MKFGMDSINNSWTVSSQILSSHIRVSLFPIPSTYENMLKENWIRPVSLITVDLRDSNGEIRGGRALSGLTLFDKNNSSLVVDVGLYHPHYIMDSSDPQNDETNEIISQAHVLLSSPYPVTQILQAYYMADLATVYAELGSRGLGCWRVMETLETSMGSASGWEMFWGLE
jgi:hypothetical protein